jgi:hypothetical protein
MKELLIAPVVIGILLSFFVQLESIANDTSVKAIAFADDMDSGLSCVLDGKLLVDCQPELFQDYGFHENINETMDVLDDMQDELESSTVKK